MLKGIHWLGHASFRIEDGVVIYIDPWKIKRAVPADLIMVTHGHFDHFSPEDIEKIATPKTVIVCPATCMGRLSGDVRPAAQGDVLHVGEVLVKAVPSYNTNKTNHPKDAGNLGYLIQVGGRIIYHAGDTDLIPEMSEIRCDVALLPVGGTYTMDADEAARAVERINPKVAIPIHYGDIVGSQRDAERFKQRAPKRVQVAVLKAER